MKTLTLVLTLTMGLASIALANDQQPSSYVCADNSIANGFLARLGTTDNMSNPGVVSLYIPGLKVNDGYISGSCERSTRLGGPSKLGAPYMDCSVRRNSDNGYTITFYVKKMTVSAAVISPYSLGGSRDPIVLPDCAVEEYDKHL